MKIFIKSISLICLMLVFTQKILTIGKGDYNTQALVNNDDELALAIQISSLDETEQKRDTETKKKQETKAESLHNRVQIAIKSLEARFCHPQNPRIFPENILLVIDALRGDVNKKNSEGKTALMYAAYNDLADIIQLLLEKGADPNLQDDQGHTALSIAILKNNENIVKILLKAGANPNIRTKDPGGRTCLIITAYYDQEKIAQLLLNANADINAKNKFGFTALMTAVIHNKTNIISLLINSRADLNLKNNVNKSAIDLTELFGWSLIKKMLEDAQLERKLEPHIRRSVRKKIAELEILPLELAELISEYAVCPKPAKKENLKITKK